MNPSPAEIVDLFTFVEITLVQYSTLTGHLAGVTAANTKVKRKKVNKVEVTQKEPLQEEPQVNAVNTTRPKRCGYLPTPPKESAKTQDARPLGQGKGKGNEKKKGKPEKRKQQGIPFFRNDCEKGDNGNYAIPVPPEI